GREHARRVNAGGLVGPDGRAVEVLPDDRHIVHARLDRVDHPVEASPAAQLVHARSAGLGIAPELEQLANAWLVLGVLDLWPPRQRRMDSSNGRAVSGDTLIDEGCDR